MSANDEYKAQAEALVIHLARYPADRAAKIDLCMKALRTAAEQAASRELKRCVDVLQGLGFGTAAFMLDEKGHTARTLHIRDPERHDGEPTPATPGRSDRPR